MTNGRKTDRDSLAAALAAEGVASEPSPLAPLALTVVSGNPFRSPLFAAGHFAVADVGSQALPLLLPPGDTLLDLAAAPGGKSFSAILHGRWRKVFALDRSLARLPLVLENRERLGIADVFPPRPTFWLRLFLPAASTASSSTRPAAERERCARSPRSATA